MFRRTLLFSLCALLALPVRGQTRDIGDVVIDADLRTTTIRIAGAPELRALAETAFRVHGRYRIVADRPAFTFTFTPAGANQVRIEITGGNPARTVFQETVTGTSQRNALFRAADAAVRQTSGLPGFFAGRLTFLSERSGHPEVYVGDLFFGEVFQLTNDRSLAVSPRWAPDGSRIIYTTYFRSGAPDLWIIDLATRNRTVFADFKGTNSGGRFSPDGRSIAAVFSSSGNPEIYIGSATARQFRRLTTNSSIEASPAWSPDGQRLIFTSDRDGRPQLFTMPATGGAMTRVPTNISGYCAEPDWSAANPNLVAFTVAQAGSFQVAVWDFSKRTSVVVTRGPGDSIEPVWAADGRHIIYTARSPNARRLMIVDTETGRATQLSPANFGHVSSADYLPPR